METTLTKSHVSEYAYFPVLSAAEGNGQRVTRRENGVGWFNYVADHLGSTRVLVKSGEYTPCYDADSLPYGEEKVYTDTCPQNYKFTGKERDAESGLDYFGARHYGSTLGRFLQIDPANVGALLPEPQTWNAYAYVGNNPLRFIDPLGLQKSDETPPQTAQDTCAQMQPRESEACTHMTEARTGQNSGGCETASNDPCGPRAPAQMSSWEFLGQELLGVWDVTGGAILGLGQSVVSGEAIENIATTAELAVTDPGAIVEAGKEGVHQVRQQANAVASGDPRAIGQVVGTVATIAYAAKNVRAGPYEHDGGGINILDTPTTNSRIALDYNAWKGSGGPKPHIDITIKKPTAPFGPGAKGPGSNLINIKHWPWN